MTATLPAAEPTTRHAFLDAVRRSGLLTPRQLEKALAVVPPAADGRAAADALVKDGALTRFQADRLLSGRADGFALGQYVILEPIGRGSAGRVYKARHRTMSRLVAIKVLAPERTRSAAAREAFAREARAAARLVHPNVVTAFDANGVGDRMYLVLEYVDGTDLETAVRRGGPLPVHRACEVARQAALALAHAHALGLCHGGLTPGNLLLGRGDRPAVKVLNFALGKLTTADTVTGGLTEAAAAADYLAPEQLTGGDPSPAADLFALGCTLHYLLVGRPPVPVSVTGPAPVLHQLGPTLPVTRHRPEVPAAVANLLCTLLEPDPAARAVTAADVAAALEPFTVPPADRGSPPLIGEIDFELPESAVGASAGTFLSGLVGVAEAREVFAELVADAAEPASVSDATPLLTHPGSAEPAGVGWALWALAAAVVLATGLAVGVVLRAVMR